ncbi:MAG: methionine--tRNA ligase [Candidatus Micrarchaeota archaeon]|nr:methionine--tRNA ligase [Candidatus Micrarchaeota archaeon]
MNSKKKVFITAALPYANGPLHLGHIRSTYLPADIYARFRRMCGDDALYICATDEHGTPIVLAAEKAGKTPKEFTDYYHEKDEKEFMALGFSFDIFHRTSSKENWELTRWFFNELKKNNYIYQKEVEQNYCKSCKRYLPDRFVIGECPKCHAKDQYSDYCEVCGSTYKADEILGPKCIVCKSTPIKRKSVHYFFKLSAFSDRLRNYLTKNSRLQQQVVNYVLNWIDNGLIDWDITRDLEWGIKIPDDESKVFYVWFDAPIGYISSLQALKNDDWKSYYESESVHFIGKDITYHHYLFWPAMLMGVNLKLPDAMPVRGYLNLEGGKFSKSKNWFVSLEDYLSEFEPDLLRYYMTILTPHDTTDADFKWLDFQTKVNNELVANFGNFVHRVLTIIKKDYDSIVPLVKQENLSQKEHLLLQEIKETSLKYKELMYQFEFKQALEMVMNLSSKFNAYLSEQQPWKLSGNTKARVIYTCMRGISALSIMLYPFIPYTIERLSNYLNIKKSDLVVENIDKELFSEYHKINEFSVLFQKIPDEKIKIQLSKLKK